VYLLNKHFHPLNFIFAERYDDQELFLNDRNLVVRIHSTADDIHHIAIRDPGRPLKDVRFEKPDPLRCSDATVSHTSLEITPDAGMRLLSREGDVLLEGGRGGWFGLCGSAWLFQFQREADMCFYGLGEKQVPFERSGRAYAFYNVDVWADHPLAQIRDGDYDPDYISIPYLIIKRGNTFIGLLSDSPYPGVISISSEAQVAEQLRIRLDYPAAVVLGAAGGSPSLYCIHGPTLAELTRKLQMLIGTTPLPPLWSLGYQQSRWGYRGDADLFELADRFEAHHFPVDGLWLDIDYMDDFRVFTFNPDHLPDPAATVAALRGRGFRVVPILDPGVKRDNGYAVYSGGLDERVFCLTGAGVPFVGMVWPGFTVFPDFSLAKARQWWARLARDFFDIGFEGAWLDMNDPSTGPVDPTSMLFEQGSTDHEVFHNQYALLMAKATRDGLLQSRPGQRPFLLSRSGSTGSQKYAAHWTGDNFSNYHHLQRSIGKSLNLALSGMPFNGPDVGGFGDDCGEQLLIDWVKSAFLFPFFRNHTMRGSRSQEPWAYSEEALKIIRRYVRLRYRLMPYLYNLFMDQEERGEAILRPLFYDFADTATLPLSHIDDQFMVGPSIMQAPFVSENRKKRNVVLPQGGWLDGGNGQWLRGERQLTAIKKRWTTPLYLREGGLIPFEPGGRIDNHHDLNHIGLFCCLTPDFNGEARYLYRSDDGIGFDYKKGGRSAVEVTARIVGGRLHLRLNPLSNGYGAVTITPFTMDRFAELVMEGESGTRRLYPEKQRVRLSGKSLTWYRWTENS
jgi:alpha-glucosidase